MTNQPKKTKTKSNPVASNNKIPPAYFLSLEIENVLCFKGKHELKLSSNDCPAQWTVILGNNGVGKTTLLRCLAGMEIIPSRKDSASPYHAYPLITLLGVSKDFKDWKEELKIMQRMMAQVNTKFICNANLTSLKALKGDIRNHPEIKTIHIEVDMQSYTPRIGFPVEAAKVMEIIHTTEQTVEEASLQLSVDFLGGAVCYGYGATRIMANTSWSDEYSTDHSITLFYDNAALMNAEEWLLQTDHAVKSASGKTRSSLKKKFDRIVEILKQILPDIKDIRITPVDEDHLHPTAEFLTPYGWVRLLSLGLGYRTTIAWIVDLVIKLFKRYPDSENPLAEPAIVLVDEIDLHMHPKWQRDIMQFLTDRFPNTQFIVTAHSPLVVQAAQDANIVLLRREGDHVVIDHEQEIIKNWRVDQVLTSVFEIPSARPPQIEKLLAERQEILSKPKISKADKAKLKELEKKIGALPTAENPDDIKAMDIIRRAAKLLEKSGAEAVE
ncbi:MAG: AAA family ATPase [Pseudanabaena sp.]|jgi:predicted ATP-binding protein involved in virulence